MSSTWRTTGAEVVSPCVISRLQSPFSPAYADYVQGHGGGPKSRAGKAASSRNAVTHGLNDVSARRPPGRAHRRLRTSPRAGHRRRAPRSRIITQPGCTIIYMLYV